MAATIKQSGVNASPKLPPDLEFQHPLWWDIHRRAGLGIAGRARLTMADAKAPEAAELNFLAAHERLGHRLEDRGDNVLALTLREAERLRQFIDQVSARHDDETPSLIFRLGIRSILPPGAPTNEARSEEHTSELQSLAYLVCRLLLEKKKKKKKIKKKKLITQI